MPGQIQQTQLFGLLQKRLRNGLLPHENIFRPRKKCKNCAQSWCREELVTLVGSLATDWSLENNTSAQSEVFKFSARVYCRPGQLLDSVMGPNHYREGKQLVSTAKCSSQSVFFLEQEFNYLPVNSPAVFMIWLTIITANANISLQYILQKAKIVSIRTRFLLFSYTRDIGASGSHLGVCVHSFANLSSSGYCTSRTQQIRKHNNLFVKWFRRNHGPFSTVQNTCVVFANLDVLLVRCLCVTSFEASFLTRFSMHLFQSTSSFVLAIFLLAKIIKCAMQLALAPCFRSPPLYSMGK